MQTLLPGTLTVVSYDAFAPVCWADHGRAAGYDIELLRAFAAHVGLRIVVTYAAFDRIWERPGRGESDIAAAGIAPLRSRAAAGVTWSAPYFTVQRSLLIRAVDALRLRTIEDFSGRAIGLTRGSTAEIDVLARKRASTQVVFYDDQRHAVRDLAAGRIDAYGTGDVCSRYLAASYPGQFTLADVHPMDPPEQFAFAVRERSGLLDTLNAFLQSRREPYERAADPADAAGVGAASISHAG
jgi:arginine/lysine/histidine transporter system substrate-binding protein